MHKISKRLACQMTIIGPGGRQQLCARIGKAKINGKWLCWQHDPEFLKAKRKALENLEKAGWLQYLNSSLYRERIEEAERAVIEHAKLWADGCPDRQPLFDAVRALEKLEAQKP